MKKNTVITMVIAALLCVVLLALNPDNMVVSAEQTVVFSETKTGSDTLHVVTLNYPDYRKILFVEDNASLGTDLLLLPESEEGMVWNWVIDGTESYLTADTAITENMSVTAVQKVDNLDKDFMPQKSGFLAATAGNNTAKIGGLIAEKNNANSTELRACLIGTSGCNPSIWSFEFSGVCTENNNGCYYYITSGGSYLKVTNVGVSVQSDKVKTLVRRHGDNTFFITSDNGKRYLNFKYISDTNNFFKNSDSNDSGSQLYFYAGESSLVTVSFAVDAKATLPAPVSVTVQSGETINLPSYGGKLNGHTFTGWADQNQTGLVTSPYTASSSTTLTAVFDENPILWFDPLNGQNAISYAYGSEGFPSTYPDDLERDGYRLVGWAETPLSNEAKYKVGDPVKLEELTEDMTLYAVWQKITKLTFVPEAGSPIKIISDVGAILDLNQLEGVRPAGRWMYTDKSGTSQYVNSNVPFITPDHDMTLYAVHDVTVTFNGNGADGENPAPIKSYTGDVIVFSQQVPVSRENYKLLGWKDQSGEFYDDSYVCKQTDDVLTAVWGYTVTFDVNGSKTNVLPVEGRTDDDSFVIPEFTGKKGNNDFLGWTTKTDENGKPIYEQGDQLYHAGDRLAENNEVVAFKYYAIYKVTLTFDKNGGGNISPARSVDNLVPYVDKVDLNKYTADFGTKTFFGWSETKTNTDVLPDEYTIGGTDHTLYAVWGSTVEFDVRGIDASVKSDSDWPETVRGLTTQTFKTAMLSSKYGRSFKGWTDGTNFYEPDVEVPFPNVNSTLYAVWDGSVTVRFDVNGGTAADLQPITQQVGTEFDQFPDYNGTKKDSRFIGWTDSNNLRDGKYHKIYTAGDKYYIPLNADTNIKFYAAWDVAEAAAQDNVKFGIRLDGSIPYEPSNYASSEYTTRAGIEKGNVVINGVVSSRQWVADSDPSMDKLNGNASNSPEERYYIVNSVTRAVGGQVPTSEQIKNIMQANGRDFDPKTEYVLWYVLKWQGNGEGRNLWHVDGVILKKDLNSLHYEGNFDGKAGNMPTGFQFMPGQEVTVGDDGKLGNYTSKIPVRGDGYQFMGWNTKADGSGTAYQNETKFTPTEKNTILYAQWEESVKTVKLRKEWSDNDDERQLRPESLLVTLNVKDANGNTFKTYRRWLTANSTDAEGHPDPWSIAVDIPAFDSAGREVRWEWIEGNNGFVPNYKEVTQRTTVGDLTTITNTLQLINVSGTKTWKDRKTVHDQVTVQLYADGVPLAERIATASDGNLTYTFTDLPEYTKEGSRINYTVREQNPPAGYEVTYDGMNVTNTHYYVTITAGSDTKVYDGTALTKEDGWTSDGLEEGDDITSVTFTGSQTVAGSSANVPSAAKIVNAAGEDVTDSYEINYVNGSLEVTQKAVTITADSDTKVYDGGELTKDSYTNIALATGDSIESVTVTGSRTVAGTSANVPSGAKIVNAAGDDVTGSYAITYANGTLEVTKKLLTITADSGTKVYDGTALTKNSYSYTSDDLAEGDSIESVTVTGSQTVVGTSANVPSEAKIVNAAGEDVTGSYEITYDNGTLEVKQKALTITADSDTKVYDGTALTKDSYTNTTLAEGDSIDSVTVTGSQTAAGSGDNVPSAAKIVNAAGEDVTGSYEITYANGTLEVTKKAVTITADSDTKVYDGTALTKDSYTNTALATGDSIESVTVTGSQTVAGKSDNDPSAARIENAAGEDVTESYEITYAKGSLEVTKKVLTITADSGTKVYDGTALTVDSYTDSGSAQNTTEETTDGEGQQSNIQSIEPVMRLYRSQRSFAVQLEENNSTGNLGLAAGDNIDVVTVTGSQTTVGSSNNVPSAAKILNAKGEDVTDSYEITYVNGTLEVTKKAVTITADSDTKVYDGTALTKDSYTNTALADGDSLNSVTVTGSQIVVGTSNNIPSAAKIVNAEGTDVTASYEITYANGSLNVTKKAVTITADSDTKVYDGTALTKDSYTNTALAAGDSIVSVTVTGSQIIVGISDNVPSAVKIVNADGEDVTASYTITYHNGLLQVTRNQSLIITADSDTKVYDGTALTKNSYQAAGLAEGDRVESVTITGTQTVVGTSNNVPTAAKIVDAAGVDKTNNYAITYRNGTLEVIGKALTIIADSDSKIYDGTALTKDSYTNTALSDGDRIDSVTIKGSRTAAGSSDNVPSGAVIRNAAGTDVTTSYEITYNNGTLNVIRKAVVIVAGSDNKVYDGNALTKDSYSHGTLIEGDRIDTVTITGSRTVAGSSDNVPSGAVIVNAAGEDVTDNYEVLHVNGTLTVLPKRLTITAKSDTKVYDGIALTNDSYTNTALAEGDRIDSVTVTGSRTIVGRSDNVPDEAKIVNAAGEDVTASYEIKYATGTLEVTQKALIIRADSESKVYDGSALVKHSYTNSTLAEGDVLSGVVISGSRTDVGTSPNTASGGVIRNAADEDVTANYSIEYFSGDLYVAPVPVKVTADSFTKEYGQLDAPFTAKVSGVLEGDEGLITYELAREEGEEPGEYVITPSGDGIQGNYSVSYVPGTLTIERNNPSAYTVSKVWNDDNNRDGIRPVSLAVTLVGSDGSVHSRRLSDANNWTTIITDLPLYYGGAPITYTWTEEAVDGYTGTSEVSDNVTVFTNTHAIARTSATVNKIWDDRDNAGGTRPEALGVILFANGERILGQTLSEANAWSHTVENLPMYENGTPINYVWNEQSAGNGYYAVRSTASGGTTTLVNSNLYSITVRYEYTDGSEASASYTDRLGMGETFVIESPTIAGYTPTLVSVVGMMPSHDVTFTVIYAAEGETVQAVAPTPIRQTETAEGSGSEPVKEIPVPREVEPDEEHPVVVLIPNILVDIDDSGTALGLGEVNHNNSGYALE